MVPANKILTVAYGTFSCTLEGFDDPFSTMTDIAEYFRDLAADDRFFGAEPPTPDMAMLRTIAETRAKHAVDARPNEGGVVLRPTAVPEPEALSTAFEVQASEPEGDLEQAKSEPAAAEPDASDAAALPAALDEPDTAETETPAETEAEDTGNAAAKLARIRDVVETDRHATMLYAEDEQVDDVLMEEQSEMADDTLVAAFAADALADEGLPEAETSDAEATNRRTIAEDTLVADLGALLLDQDWSAEVLETGATEEPAEEDREVESATVDTEEPLAPAAVSEGESPYWTDDQDEEDAKEENQVRDISVAEAPVDEVAEAEDADATAEEFEEIAGEPEVEALSLESETTAPDVEVEPVDEIDAEAVVEEAAGDDTAAVAAQSDDRSPVEAEEDAATRRARRIRVRKIRRADAALADMDDDDLPASIFAEDTSEPAENGEEDDMAAVSLAEDDRNAFAGEVDVEPETAADEEDLIAELAAIEAELVLDAAGSIREKDAAETEIDGPADLTGHRAAIREDDEGDGDADSLDVHAAEALVSMETEAMIATAGQMEPMQTAGAGPSEDEGLETRTADMAGSGEETAADLEDADVADGDAGAEAETDPVSAAPSDPDMERLFAATDSRLSGEDTSRRHANISHLKAAVAARRADGPIAPPVETESDPYRADLADTVRPRRAARAAEGGTDRPARPERPAPLVLVSEQRVAEDPEPTKEAPVQPRRAARLREDEAQEAATLRSADASVAEDFEQFAADVGAVELPDILEAAAVYSARIMGQDNFSRPRLLHLAAEACDDLSREDGLRGFGQLLRDGTIRKVSRGTFALATDSRYTPDSDRRTG